MDKKIPVVVIKELSETEKILTALKNDGINCAEITFRTACAEDAIKLAVEKFPDMNVGAGTVINKTQCKKAIKAGAKFIVSPGLSADVAKVCKANKSFLDFSCIRNCQFTVTAYITLNKLNEISVVSVGISLCG